MLKVSVIAAVYNVEKYLCRFIESVINQTYTDFEFILVDDGSTDSSYEICKKYAVQDSRIKIIKKNNGGLASARNAGLFSSCGDFLYFCDSDDWLEPNLLEELVNNQLSSNSDIACCDCYLETENDSIIYKNIIPSDIEECIHKLLDGSLYGFVWEKLFRADLFRNNDISWIEGLDMHEDLLICMKIFSVASKISYCEKPLYHYVRTNQQSLTYSIDEKKLLQVRSVAESLKNELNKNGTYLKYRDSFCQRLSLYKIWHLENNLNKKTIDLYTEYKLSECKLLSRNFRLFSRLCEKRHYILATLFFKLYKAKQTIKN